MTNALTKAKINDQSLADEIPSTDWAKSYKTSELEIILNMHLARLPEANIKPLHNHAPLRTMLRNKATLHANNPHVTYEIHSFFDDVPNRLAN